MEQDESRLLLLVRVLLLRPLRLRRYSRYVEFLYPFRIGHASLLGLLVRGHPLDEVSAGERTARVGGGDFQEEETLSGI